MLPITENNSQNNQSSKIPAVNKNLCIACGLCTTIASNTFELGSDGKSQVKTPQGDPREKVQEAIESCPVSAISWE